MKKIYVFGSFVMDHTTRCAVLPRDGESVFGESFAKSYGGKGINQAMMIKRLGGDVTMIGALGNDSNGQEFLNLLKENGFDVSKIFIKETFTGVSNIIIDKNSQNRIIVVAGANDCLTSQDILSIKDDIKEESVFLIQNEIPIDTIKTIIDLGVSKRCEIILNPAPYKAYDKNTLDKVSYLTPNENEAMDLFGLDHFDIDAILNEFDKYETEHLILTLGDKGSLYYDHKNKLEIKPHKVKAIDTVGAGDAFNGGLTYGLAYGLDIKQSLDIANACGALTVMKKGALASQPNKMEVLQFLMK